MARHLDALTASTLKNLRAQWWDSQFSEFLQETLRPRPGTRILRGAVAAAHVEYAGAGPRLQRFVQELRELRVPPLRAQVLQRRGGEGVEVTGHGDSGVLLSYRQVGNRPALQIILIRDDMSYQNEMVSPKPFRVSLILQWCCGC